MSRRQISPRTRLSDESIDMIEMMQVRSRCQEERKPSRPTDHTISIFDIDALLNFLKLPEYADTILSFRELNLKGAFFLTVMHRRIPEQRNF